MNDAGKQARIDALEEGIAREMNYITLAQGRLDALRQELAELLCPFKVGDRVRFREAPAVTATVVDKRIEYPRYVRVRRAGERTVLLVDYDFLEARP